MDLRSRLLAAVFAAVAALGGASVPARAADAVKVGEINSYSTMPAFTVPYRKGWELAVEEVNAGGGVLGGASSR